MQLLSGIRHHANYRIVRYLFAGVAVSLGYTFTVLLLVEWSGLLRPAWASAASFVLWTPISYVAHRDFTFRFDGAHRSAATKYLVAFLLRFAASALVVAGIEYLSFHYLLGVLLNWAVLPLINYVVLSFWVFREGSAVKDMAGACGVPHSATAKGSR
jgi:putative flippase GtrA